MVFLVVRCMIEILTTLAPGWVWVATMFTLVTAWVLGRDTDRRDQDAVDRIFRGVIKLAVYLSHGIVVILKQLSQLMVVSVEKLHSALRRTGQFIDENVTIQIVLDGAFWKLMMVLVLISSGYLTWTALGF